MGNKNMHKAKRNKNDEFYTKYEDIEKEVFNYKKQLKGKVIYCNCDSRDSNFYKYFKKNFSDLGLKKLFISGIKGELIIYNGKSEVVETIDGDFRSDATINILKKSDMVITNPPFSLFREYVAQLMEYKKDFLIIGNFNAVTYKETFPLIKENRMWLGYNSPKEFTQPDESVKKVFTCWFTNLKVQKNNEKLSLVKSYKNTPNQYPKYDNYDAIEVSRVANIPYDYDGIMGVPITFLTKHNPEQFEILGSQRWAKSEELLNTYIGDCEPADSDKKTLINGLETYDRIFIKRVQQN